MKITITKSIEIGDRKISRSAEAEIESDQIPANLISRLWDAINAKLENTQAINESVAEQLKKE